MAERVADMWRNLPLKAVANGRLPDKAPAQFNNGSSAEPRVVVFLAEGMGVP